MHGKHWNEFSPRQRKWIVVLSAVQVLLAAVAWLDLGFRPADAVNGRKPLWAAVIAVNFVGPIAYLRWGRRRYGDDRVRR